MSDDLRLKEIELRAWHLYGFISNVSIEVHGTFDERKQFGILHQALGAALYSGPDPEQQEEISRLKKANAKLREALKGFYEQAGILVRHYDDENEDDLSRAVNQLDLMRDDWNFAFGPEAALDTGGDNE